MEDMERWDGGRGQRGMNGEGETRCVWEGEETKECRGGGKKRGGRGWRTGEIVEEQEKEGKGKGNKQELRGRRKTVGKGES